MVIFGAVAFSSGSGYGRWKGCWLFQTNSDCPLIGCMAGQVHWLYWLQECIAPVLASSSYKVFAMAACAISSAQRVTNPRHRVSEHPPIPGKLLVVWKDKPGEVNDMAVLSMATGNVFAGSNTTSVPIALCFATHVRTGHVYLN